MKIAMMELFQERLAMQVASQDQSKIGIAMEGTALLLRSVSFAKMELKILKRDVMMEIV